MKRTMESYSIIFAALFWGQSVLAADCTVVECAQQAVDAAYEAKEAFKTALPKGAVMAFNLSKCPNGWKEYVALQGRTIVGAGQGFDLPNNTALTKRTLNEDGGAETHTLSVGEVPKHTHTFKSDPQELGGWDNGQTVTDRPGVGAIANTSWGKLVAKGTTDNTGEGKSHNNMQPFHVLKFCERL